MITKTQTTKITLNCIDGDPDVFIFDNGVVHMVDPDDEGDAICTWTANDMVELANEIIKHYTSWTVLKNRIEPTGAFEPLFEDDGCCSVDDCSCLFED